MTITCDHSEDRGAAILAALPLVDDAQSAIEDAELLVAGIRELEQRVNAGIITAETRRDLGSDLLALSESLNAYALRVLA